MSSAICFNLDQSKILSSGNGLNKNIDLEEFKIRKLACALFPEIFRVLWNFQQYVYRKKTEAYPDGIDQDQTVQNVQSNLGSKSSDCTGKSIG